MLKIVVVPSGTVALAMSWVARFKMNGSEKGSVGWYSN